MIVNFLKSKISYLTITDADLHYEGSITLDSDIMKAADLREYQQVDVLNQNNGQRFTTYIIEDKTGLGVCCINGAAARLCQIGDKVILLAYCGYDSDVQRFSNPTIIMVDEGNRLKGLPPPK